jgi:hypothetical protein
MALTGEDAIDPHLQRIQPCQGEKVPRKRLPRKTVPAGSVKTKKHLRTSKRYVYGPKLRIYKPSHSHERKTDRRTKPGGYCLNFVL